jgi:hypothetical protein
VFVEQKNSFEKKNDLQVYCGLLLHLRVTLTWLDDIQNGETHGRVKLIKSTQSCRKKLSSKVWINFSLIFLCNMYIYVLSIGRASLRGCERTSPSITDLPI